MLGVFWELVPNALTDTSLDFRLLVFYF